MNVLDYYERVVNASGFPLRKLLLGIAPTGRPPVSNDRSTGTQAESVISLERFSDRPDLELTGRSEQLSTVAHVLVHGSQATGDTCNFSDVDVLVVLDDRQPFGFEQHVQAADELKRLLARTFEYDPLMHHGLMFLRSSDLLDYDESVLPMAALRLARVLHGPNQLAITTRTPDRRQALNRLEAGARSIQMQFAAETYLRGDFQLKNLISGVLLLPALFLAKESQYVYKRESFELARTKFSAATWSFMEAAELIRRNWIRPPVGWLASMLAARGHPRRRTLLSELLPSRLNVAQPAMRQLASVLKGQSDMFLSQLVSRD